MPPKTSTPGFNVFELTPEQLNKLNSREKGVIQLPTKNKSLDNFLNTMIGFTLPLENQDLIEIAPNKKRVKDPADKSMLVHIPVNAFTSASGKTSTVQSITLRCCQHIEGNNFYLLDTEIKINFSITDKNQIRLHSFKMITPETEGLKPYLGDEPVGTRSYEVFDNDDISATPHQKTESVYNLLSTAVDTLQPIISSTDNAVREIPHAASSFMSSAYSFFTPPKLNNWAKAAAICYIGAGISCGLGMFHVAAGLFIAGSVLGLLAVYNTPAEPEPQTYSF